MRKTPAVLIAGLVFLLPVSSAVAAPGSAACKRELASASSKMRQSLALVTGAMQSAPKERCTGLFRHLGLTADLRESFARCSDGEAHADALRDIDEVREETEKAIGRLCPPTPGMVRVNLVMVKRVGIEELPAPLAAAHRCDAPARMAYTNEPFDGGRIVTLACRGKDNAAAAELAARNVSARAFAEEQSAVYLALDSSGRGARRLTFPILLADGSEGKTDLLPAQGTFAQKRNLLVGNWAPAKEGVCRIHAEWIFLQGKPSLVLWQEVVDCAKLGAPELRTILDRR